MAKSIILLDGDDIRAIVADHYGVPVEEVECEIRSRSEGYGPGEHQVDYVQVKITKEEIEDKPQAYWEYWGGWAGNHDKRIDSAKCSIESADSLKIQKLQ